MAQSKKCPRCLKLFECGQKEGTCWCFSLKISEESLTKMQSCYTDCLCFDCLEEMDKSEKNSD